MQLFNGSIEWLHQIFSGFQNIITLRISLILKMQCTIKMWIHLMGPHTCVTNINVWLHSNIFHSIINAKKLRICNTHILPYALPTNEHVVSLFLRHLCITWKESRILKWHCFSWGLKILLILKNADSISLKMGEQQHQQHNTHYHTTHML